MNIETILSRAGNYEKSFMPLSIALQIGGSNTRLVSQGFDPQDKEGEIVQKIQAFKANGHDKESGIRSDLFAIKNIISAFTQKFNQFLEQFPELEKLKPEDKRLPITIETAGFKASAENLESLDIDSSKIKKAYEAGSLSPKHTLFLPNVDAGNNIPGLDPKFFALDEFSHGFKQANNRLELEGKEIASEHGELASTISVTNLNDCQAGSRAVGSQMKMHGFNNLHVILGTGANIFIGENFSTDNQSYEKETNTEFGHIEPFQGDELTFLESWRKDQGLKTTFEELFAGGNDNDTNSNDPSYHRGIKGITRFVRSLDRTGFNMQHLGAELQRVVNPNNLDEDGDVVIDLNDDSISDDPNLDDWSLMSASKIFKVDDNEITPRKIDELAQEGDVLAQGLIKYQAVRLAHALVNSYSDQLKKTDVISLHGSSVVKSFQRFPAAKKIFEREYTKLIGKKPIVFLSQPKEDMDGLVELTQSEAQNSLVYKAALEYLKS